MVNKNTGMESSVDLPLTAVGEDEGESYKEIYNQICTMLANGTLSVGQKLPGERVLAQRFGVGRASVRIALKFLEFIGLVRSKVGKGVFVSSKPRDLAAYHVMSLMNSVRNDPFRDLFETRLILETTMAGLAAVNATEESLARLRDCLDQQHEALVSKKQSVDAIDDFHGQIYSASGNVILGHIGLILQTLMHESRQITQAIPGRAERSLEEHEQIYQAIASKDREQAEELMRQHLRLIANDRFSDWGGGV